MEKKVMKWYETPMVETVELEARVSLLAGSGESNADDVTTEPGELL